MHKKYFILAACLFLAFLVHAQEKEYVYKDSTLDAPQEETIAQPDTAYTSSGYQIIPDEPTTPDTLLYYYPSDISADTILSWKNAKAFAYAKYLDSLLKRPKIKKEKRPYYPSPLANPGLKSYLPPSL
jgi:hypothetical protein